MTVFVIVSFLLTLIASIPIDLVDAEIVEAQAFGERQFEEVFLQAQDQDTPTNSVVVEKVIGPDGGDLVKILYEDSSDRFFPSGDAIVIVRENALKNRIAVKFTILSENSSSYPALDFLQGNYLTEKIKYIGPLVTLEVPYEALNLESEEDQLIFAITPSFYEGELDRMKQRDIRLEVRVFLEDGDITFNTMRFGYAGEALIWSDFLKASFGDDLPETVKISVQAVDISDALSNPDDFLGP